MKYQSDMKTYIKQMVPGCYIGCIVNSTTNIETAVLLDGAKLLLTWNESKTNRSLDNIYTVNPGAQLSHELVMKYLKDIKSSSKSYTQCIVKTRF